MSVDPLDLLAAAADERERELYESGGDKLDRIGRAGKKAQAIEREIVNLEDAIASKKRELQELRTKIIPDLLRSAGLNAFTLDDGTNVELKDELFPDIPAAQREEAYAWLRDNGHGDLIKHEIKIVFGMGEDIEALAIRKQLSEHNSPLNFTEKETILPQSLRAWVREQERRGTDLPNELFAVHRVTTAHLKKGK
jgi:hypothetical protein